MRCYSTWMLVLLFSLSVTLGCGDKSSSSTGSSSSDQVADSGATADAGSGESPDTSTGDDPGMDGDPGEEGMDEDLAGSFEGEEGFDPSEEGMDEDLAEDDFDPADEAMDEDLGSLEGEDDFDPADEAMDEDLAGFEGDEGFDPGSGDPAAGGFAGGRRPTPRKPATLLGSSQAAFAQGQNRNAFNYAYAAVLLDPEAGPKLLSQYQWVPGLRRPALGVRWGIGIQFVGSKDAQKQPYPIGVDQKLPERRSSRNRGDDFGAGGSPDDFGEDPGFGDDGLEGGFPGSGGGQRGNSELKKYTGILGDKVIRRLQARIDRDYYGTFLKTAKTAGSSTGRSGGQSAGGFDPADGGFDPADDGLDPADEGFDPADEGFDPADEGIDPGAGFGGGRRSSSGSGLPGVTMLGVGSLEELGKKAQKSDLDAVIIFEVRAAVNRKTKLVTNNTTIQLYDVHMAKVVKKNKTALNNVKIQIQNKTAKGNEVDEMIEKEIDQIFLAAEAYRMQALPELTAQVVLDNRIMPMVSKKYENPLPMLAELRYWHSKKLLTTEHLAIACRELVGEQVAQQLLSGDAKLQQAIVKTLLSSNATEGKEVAPAFR